MDYMTDGFAFSTLMAAINDIPYSQSAISRVQLFKESGINSTKVRIEQIGKILNLVRNVPRGAPGQVHVSPGRVFFDFKAPHLKLVDTILAATWQDTVGYGTGLPAEITKERNRILGEQRQNFETTFAYMMCRALDGEVLDADGTTTLLDFFSEMGVAQQTYDMALDVETTRLSVKMNEAKRLSESALGSATPKGWVAICSPSFIDKMIGHPAVEDAFDRLNDGEYLREDQRPGFVYQNCLWVEQRNLIDGRTFIDEGAAMLCPLGIPDLFNLYFAPADYVETVNTVGQPLYSKAEPLPMDRGYTMEAQSNPLPIVRRPHAVIKLTI